MTAPTSGASERVCEHCGIGETARDGITVNTHPIGAGLVRTVVEHMSRSTCIEQLRTALAARERECGELRDKQRQEYERANIAEELHAAAVEQRDALQRTVEEVKKLRAPSLCNDGTNGEYLAGHRDGFVDAINEVRNLFTTPAREVTG